VKEYVRFLSLSIPLTSPQPGMSGYDQFVALQQHFARCQVKTCALLLTSYAKIMNLYPDCKDIVMEVFQKQSTSGFLELQQRACEYMRLPSVGAELMENVLNTMPVYPENRDNILLARLNKGGEHATADKSAWESEKPEHRREEEEEEPPRAYASAPSVQKVAVEVDLLSLDDDTPVSASDSGAVRGLSEDILPSLRKWFNSALISPPGKAAVLFENSVIQITTQGEYRAHQGRMLVLFHNKTDEIQDLSVSISSSVDYVRIQKNVSHPLCFFLILRLLC
jgi:AP-2 complex subunit alpha